MKTYVPTKTCRHIVTTECKCKFVCPTHSEAKQTETLEVGAEKDLLQGHAGRKGGSYPKSPELLEGFQQSTFKGEVRERCG